LVIVGALTPPIFAAEVTGELVDHECYLKDKLKNVGSGHQDCATLCALKGQTLAVVTEKGEVYEIAGDVTKDNNSALMPHMSHRVVLTGEVVDKDGKRTIVATDVRMAGKR
jgi:hypothetical protein